jgi:threonylcarbamoyladenosine tRNA methylthiotransferase MtaB
MISKKKIAFHTLGCKLNYTETSTISKLFPDDQYLKTDFKENADIYIINTCCVTENAEKKCRQFIRQAHKNNPSAVIAVVGCYSQLDAGKIASIEGVSVVMGNEDKFHVRELIEQKTKKKEAVISNVDINKISTFMPSFSTGDRTRSFLKVQDGCDYFCSYCTVPYVRGRSRSSSIEEVILSINNIVEQGIKEIVLTGINIGDFGKHNELKFIDLLTDIENNTTVERVRISSIEPDLLSENIIKLVSRSGKFMPHFHIPLQSGSDRILKAMGRKYTTTFFSELVSRIKTLIPHCCIASDVIAGFPGETADDFDETCSYIENSDISYLHVFPYSERANTPSSRLNGRIDPSEKKRRSVLLQNLSDTKKNDFYQLNRGKLLNVLFESEINKGYLLGFTDNYIRVKTHFNEKLINDIVPVKLSEIGEDGIYKVEMMSN